MGWLGSIGAASGFLAVALGAFGAHVLEDSLSDRAIEVFDLASRYQLVHGLVIVVVHLLGRCLTSSTAGGGRPKRSIRRAGWFLVAGTTIFSGSLYALALSGVSGFGAITPIGGVLLLVGWATLGWALIPRG